MSHCELIPLRSVESITGCKHSKIYALIREKAFPSPAKIGKASRWSRREVEAWIADRLSERPGDAA